MFQRAMSKMIQDLDWTEAIYDDILVWETTKAERDKRLTTLLDRARQQNTKLNVERVRSHAQR